MTVTTNPSAETIAQLVANACADLARQLVAEGLEGAHYVAAFSRLKDVVARTVVAAVDGVAQATAGGAISAPAKPASVAMTATSPRRRTKTVVADPRQREFLLASDGGRAKEPPMSPAERQAVRRARQRNVTLRDINARQVIETIEESRNVTKIGHLDTQGVDFVAQLSVSSRDSVTRGSKKEVPPHPLKKKLHPPKSPPVGEIITVRFDDPLLEVIETMLGERFPRFGKGRSFRRKVVDQALALQVEQGMGTNGGQRRAG